MEETNGCCAPSRSGFSAEPKAQASGVSQEPLKTDGMVLIPSQSFLMGSESSKVFHGDGEGPVREVQLKSFWIDQATVTNSQFAKFIEATSYRTEAEEYGWSFVFEGQLSEETLKNHVQGRSQNPHWWVGIMGAKWDAPHGPGSSILDTQDHPVVHVSWNDAVAFANWSGKKLPTEAQWECAARGGLEQKTYPWGDDFQVKNKPGANIWQGNFPNLNLALDGYSATAPATSLEPNGYGLYNCVGNVWEWTADWYSPNWHQLNIALAKSDPVGPAAGTGKITKGGSFMCHDSYCNRYRVSARTMSTPETSLSHTGFRLTRDG
jgi:formylglycine-generating enzyme required for sulfatase activity